MPAAMDRDQAAVVTAVRENREAAVVRDDFALRVR